MVEEFKLNIQPSKEEILIYFRLCKEWKNMVSTVLPANKDYYMKKLQNYADRIKEFCGVERITLHWDNELGLNCVDVRYGNATGLLLQDDDIPNFYPHNIDTPEQALALISTVLKYVHDIKVNYENRLPNWHIWPIEITGEGINPELSIKINLHPRLEEIVKGMNKTEQFKRFIESNAPFSNEGYSSLDNLDFNWDDKVGIHAISVIPQGINRPGLYLKDDLGTFCYYDHNVKEPIHALALIGAVSNYMSYLKMKEKELRI